MDDDFVFLEGVMKLGDGFKFDILNGRIDAADSPMVDMKNEGGSHVGRLRYDSMRLEIVQGAARLVLCWRGKDTAILEARAGERCDIAADGSCALVVEG